MNEKLLLQDLVALLAKKTGATQKDTDRFYRELIRVILDGIYQKDAVKIKNLGTFKLVLISSRESVDVNTGQKIEIPSHYRLSFTPDRSFKELVNEPYAQLETVLLDDDVSTSSDLEDEDDEFENEFDLLEKDVMIDPEDFDDIDAPEDELLPIELSAVKPSVNKVGGVIKTTSQIVREVFREEKDSNTNRSVESPRKKSLLDVIKPLDIASRKTDSKSTERIQPILEKKPIISVSDVNNKPLLDRVDRINKVDQKKQVVDIAGPLVDTDLRGGAHVENEVEEENIPPYEYSYDIKPTKLSKFKKKLPVIVASVLIGVFAIYQFAKLFDYTPDYVYYMNRNYQLSLTDTLPYLMEKDAFVDTLETFAVASKEKLEGSKLKSTDQTLVGDSRDTIAVNNQISSISRYRGDDKILADSASDLDSLYRKLDVQNDFQTTSFQISNGLNIRVANKADLYLKSLRSEPKKKAK